MDRIKREEGEGEGEGRRKKIKMQCLKRLDVFPARGCGVFPSPTRTPFKVRLELKYSIVTNPDQSDRPITHYYYYFYLCIAVYHTDDGHSTRLSDGQNTVPHRNRPTQSSINI